LNRVQFPAGGNNGGRNPNFGAIQNLPNLSGAARDSAIAGFVSAGGIQAIAQFGGFGGGRGAATPGCGGNAGGGGRGGRGGGSALTPGWYTAKLSVNGRDYTKTFQVLEDKWAADKWAIDR
jgi:hypothetical protein